MADIGGFLPVEWDYTDGLTCRLHPRRKGGRIDQSDIINTLVHEGLYGETYVQIHRIGEEFVSEEDVPNTIDLYSAQDAIIPLAAMNGWIVVSPWDCKVYDFCNTVGSEKLQRLRKALKEV